MGGTRFRWLCRFSNSGGLGLEHSHLHVPIRISGSHTFVRALTLALKTCEGCSPNNLCKPSSETTAPGREPQTVCPLPSGEEEVCICWSELGVNTVIFSPWCIHGLEQLLTFLTALTLPHLPDMPKVLYKQCNVPESQSYTPEYVLNPTGSTDN